MCKQSTPNFRKADNLKPMVIFSAVSLGIRLTRRRLTLNLYLKIDCNQKIVTDKWFKRCGSNYEFKSSNFKQKPPLTVVCYFFRVSKISELIAFFVDTFEVNRCIELIRFAPLPLQLKWAWTIDRLASSSTWRYGTLNTFWTKSEPHAVERSEWRPRTVNKRTTLPSLDNLIIKH